MRATILVLIENEIKTYHLSKDERKKISDIEWDEENECDVLGEILMRVADLNGILLCVKDNDCINIKSKIDFLKNRSIYKNKCIVAWINKYSEKFPKYWNHIKTVENLRIAGLSYFENIVLSNNKEV